MPCVISFTLAVERQCGTRPAPIAYSEAVRLRECVVLPRHLQVPVCFVREVRLESLMVGSGSRARDELTNLSFGGCRCALTAFEPRSSLREGSVPSSRARSMECGEFPKRCRRFAMLLRDTKVAGAGADRRRMVGISGHRPRDPFISEGIRCVPLGQRGEVVPQLCMVCRLSTADEAIDFNRRQECSVILRVCDVDKSKRQRTRQDNNSRMNGLHRFHLSIRKHHNRCARTCERTPTTGCFREVNQILRTSGDTRRLGGGSS